jgi:hypothetical protein
MTEMPAEPSVTQVDAEGKLTLTQSLLSPFGLHRGDQVLVLSPRPGLICLHKTDAPEPPSREELSQLLRAAFEDAGYTTREQILTLVREAKRDLSEEW